MAKKNTTTTTKASSKKKPVRKSSSASKPNKTKQLEEALSAEKEKYLRLFAEFENYKKRTAKERIELFKTANQEVITSLIPVLDDFNRERRVSICSIFL